MASMASMASTGSHTNISNTNGQQPQLLPRLHQPQLTNGLIDNVPCPPLMTASMASNSRVSAAMVPVASSAPSMEHIPRNPQQDEQNGQKTLGEDGLVFRSPEMKRSLQRPNSSKKKKMSKKSKHTNRPQDRPKPTTANPANGHQNHHSKSNSSTEDSDNSDSFYETLRRHQRKHRTSSKNCSSNSNVSAAKK